MRENIVHDIGGKRFTVENDVHDMYTFLPSASFCISTTALIRVSSVPSAFSLNLFPSLKINRVVTLCVLPLPLMMRPTGLGWGHISFVFPILFLSRTFAPAEKGKNSSHGCEPNHRKTHHRTWPHTLFWSTGRPPTIFIFHDFFLFFFTSSWCNADRPSRAEPMRAVGILHAFAKETVFSWIAAGWKTCFAAVLHGRMEMVVPYKESYNQCAVIVSLWPMKSSEKRFFRLWRQQITFDIYIYISLSFKLVLCNNTVFLKIQACVISFQQMVIVLKVNNLMQLKTDQFSIDNKYYIYLLI